jgi:predicted MFS family arabinose efflux permease
VNNPRSAFPHAREPSPTAVAWAGLAALAVAMGVGRFAFTPILPMMQQDAGLSVAGGGWLASANYLGFLLGALSVIRLRVRPATAIRGSLIAIGVVTFAMGIEHRFAAWFILRACAGIANGWAQTFAFAWSMEKLSAVDRPLLNGVVCAGVGTGIVVTGGFCLVLMYAGASSAQAWIGLAVISLIVTAAIWRIIGADDDMTAGGGRQSIVRDRRWHADSLRLVLCFGASGFGYIIPATFLPVMARQIISDPLIFGWSWPIFGAAAALSPLAAARWTRILGNRRMWFLSHLVMAIGITLPVWWPAIGGIIVAALMIGATFMINAMASMQEAQIVAGPQASRLMAAMIAAFATGQIVGPLSVSYRVGPIADFSKPLLVASLVLVASAYALSRRPASKTRSELSS